MESVKDCTECHGSLSKVESRSEKNPGREYWSCNDRSHGFFGWCDEGPSKAYKKRKFEGGGNWSAPKNDGLLNGIDKKLDAVLILLNQFKARDAFSPHEQ